MPADDPKRPDPEALLAAANKARRGRLKVFLGMAPGVGKTSLALEVTLQPGEKSFTDEELKRIDKFVRDNTIERFGPVRSVRADLDVGLVFEVAFEGLQRSSRHKSGVAMRFPRINRIRWDKPAREADELSTLEAMLD